MLYRKTLVVFAKAPRLGLVKTRLGREIGGVEALRVYRVLLGDVLRRLSGDPRWTTLVAVAPDSAVGACALPEHIDQQAQGAGGLGARMQRIFDAMPAGPVVIVGSDIPGITRRHIAAAFAALGDHDVAAGPAPDGGYWLIGAKRFPRVPRIFDNVRWSSAHALADTLRNAADLQVALLDELEDVDDRASWQRWLRSHKECADPIVVNG